MAVVALMIGSASGIIGFLAAWLLAGTGLLVALGFYAAIGTVAFFAVIALGLLAMSNRHRDLSTDAARA